MGFRFTIAESFTPETLPMERLAEYVAALAAVSTGTPVDIAVPGISAGTDMAIRMVSMWEVRTRF